MNNFKLFNKNKMKFFSNLLILIPFIIGIDPGTPIEGEDMEKFQKKAKTLACSFLASNALLSLKNKEKHLKDLLKKKKIIKSDSEADDKVLTFMTAICYTKITPEIASEILLLESEGKSDIGKNEKYNIFFKLDQKVNLKKAQKLMNEVDGIMKEIDFQEGTLQTNNKDKNELDLSKKDFGKKLIKNQKYSESIEEKNEKIKEKNNYKNNKKRKKKEKLKKEEKKSEKIVKNENKPPRRKKSFSFKNFIQKLDLNTIWGFIISLIIVLIFPCISTRINNNNYINKKYMENSNNKVIKGEKINEINNRRENKGDINENKKDSDIIKGDNNTKLKEKNTKIKKE